VQNNNVELISQSAIRRDELNNAKKQVIGD